MPGRSILTEKKNDFVEIICATETYWLNQAFCGNFSQTFMFWLPMFGTRLLAIIKSEGLYSGKTRSRYDRSLMEIVPSAHHIETHATSSADSLPKWISTAVVNKYHRRCSELSRDVSCISTYLSHAEVNIGTLQLDVSLVELFNHFPSGSISIVLMTICGISNL